MREEAERDGKSYTVMRSGDAVIRHRYRQAGLDGHEYFGRFRSDEPRGLGVEVVLTVEDLDVTYVHAQVLGCVVADLRLRPWGVRDFRAVDPSGYYLRFTEQADASSDR